MTKWDIPRESFLLTFSSEDEVACIDEVLQEIKATIFNIHEEPVQWVQQDLNTQMCHALECYNMTAKEKEEDPRKTNIP